MLLSITWEFNPELFTIFGHEVRWYGLCWGIGIALASFIVYKLFKLEKVPENWFDSIFIYIVVAVVIGARLGHCLFYNPSYYLSHPVEILKVWEGGLASHGGVIGIIIGVWLFSRKVHTGMLWTFDRLVIGACVTATFIRLGNFLNSEVYGKPTDLPWGVRFVLDKQWYLPVDMGGSGAMPSHPTQIYEALIYLTLFGVSLFLFLKTNAKYRQGLILGICMIGIFLSRILIEFLKNVQEPFEIEMRAKYGMDMGQLLSIPFVIWGIWLVWNAFRKEPNKQKIKAK